ncbi:hypothetical protein [Sphingomonas sp. PB4P5]|uniref:hypothetical protein n=1 Tax=Parasphingomonas puruogangriensis TaxID=3096155 RepID=UPI002FC59B02
MSQTPPVHTGTSFTPWRLAGWATIVGLIALPAIAMQFTTEVNWAAEDFLFAIVMLGGVGGAIELAVRACGGWAYRAGAVVALGAGCLTLWGNAAVGIVGNESNDINMWFNAVPLVALLGAIVARFRGQGMAAAMTVTAAAQLSVGIVMALSGHVVWPFTIVSTAVWLISAWLFRKAAYSRPTVVCVQPLP